MPGGGGFVADIRAYPKTVLITGCSSGIGRDLAGLLRENGWRVFATARKAADVKKLQDDGFEACLCDVCDTATMQQTVEFVFDKTDGQLSAVVNNAGFGQPGAVEDLTRDMLREQFEVNVFGLIELTNMILPIFRKQKYGRVVNISSVAGLVSGPYAGAYGASKFALEALSDSMRIELAGTGIDVVLIEPGPLDSSFSDHLRDRMANKLVGQSSCHDGVYKLRAKRRDPRKTFFSQPARVCSKVILKALCARKPRRRYVVTRIGHVIALMHYTMPVFVMDLILGSRIYHDRPETVKES